MMNGPSVRLQILHFCSMQQVALKVQFEEFFSHEFASLECGHIRRTKVEPLSVFPLFLKSSVPVRFDSCRVIRADDMHGLEFLWQLNAKFILPASRCVASAE